MNKFDELFFSKYVPEGAEVLFVCHRHVTLVIDRIFLILFFAVFLVSFFFFNDTFSLRSLVPFPYFEGYLVAVYLYLLYCVFDWYNDVWIVTDEGVIDLDWNVFAGNVTYVPYHSVHGVEIRRDSVFDSLLGKGDIVILLAEDRGEDFGLLEAADPEAIADFIQEEIEKAKKARDKHAAAPQEDTGPDDREPFQILLDTLTEMVKDHLERKGPRESPEEKRMAEEILKRAKRRKSTIDLSTGSLPAPAEDGQGEGEGGGDDENGHDSHGGGHAGH